MLADQKFCVHGGTALTWLVIDNGYNSCIRALISATVSYDVLQLTNVSVFARHKIIQEISDRTLRKTYTIELVSGFSFGVQHTASKMSDFC